MTSRAKAAIFSAFYILLFFLVALISMRVFTTIIFSIGIVMVAEIFSKLFTYFLGIPKKISIVLSLLIIFTGIGFLMFFLIPAVFSEVTNFVNFINSFFVNREWENLFTENFLFPEVEANITEFLLSVRPRLIDFINDWLVTLPNLGQQVGTFLFFIVLVSIYLSFYFDNFKLNILKLFPKSSRKITFKFLKDVYNSLKAFVISTLFASLFVGIGAFIAMNFLGIKYSLLLSFWAALTNFIPIVGVIFEFIPLILVGISSGLPKMLILLLVMVILHGGAFIFFLYVMKGRARINPVAIIVSILFFGAIFSYLGPLIATPLALIIKVYWINFISPSLERR